MRRACPILVIVALACVPDAPPPVQTSSSDADSSESGGAGTSEPLGDCAAEDTSWRVSYEGATQDLQAEADGAVYHLVASDTMDLIRYRNNGTVHWTRELDWLQMLSVALDVDPVPQSEGALVVGYAVESHEGRAYFVSRDGEDSVQAAWDASAVVGAHVYAGSAYLISRDVLGALQMHRWELETPELGPESFALPVSSADAARVVSPSYQGDTHQMVLLLESDLYCRGWVFEPAMADTPEAWSLFEFPLYDPTCDVMVSPPTGGRFDTIAGDGRYANHLPDIGQVLLRELSPAQDSTLVVSTDDPSGSDRFSSASALTGASEGERIGAHMTCDEGSSYVDCTIKRFGLHIVDQDGLSRVYPLGLQSCLPEPFLSASDRELHLTVQSEVGQELLAILRDRL